MSEGADDRIILKWNKKGGYEGVDGIYVPQNVVHGLVVVKKPVSL